MNEFSIFTPNNYFLIDGCYRKRKKTNSVLDLFFWWDGEIGKQKEEIKNHCVCSTSLNCTLNGRRRNFFVLLDYLSWRKKSVYTHLSIMMMIILSFYQSIIVITLINVRTIHLDVHYEFLVQHLMCMFVWMENEFAKVWNFWK